ncbi:sulfite exporter TauE/SafE family protein [Halobacillus litoralis]|uniref:sulfite exporter TauE/SafE family protein n=1 Tax=Halobacillus litoralis TaxID=45668 RepID=UPI001CD1C40C|nr:sulfite exporter TauE/SafE family protein [Halobacillus litoralis]MCA0972495.1 sulfite exporter TauE/SafE family protein [Halobacillus litoralis]
MSVLFFLAIFAAGVGAGFVNVMAGGGSLLTLPLLILFGLPSAVANGTNRIALLAQNIVAIASFRKGGYFDWKFSTMLAVPALIGSVAGAQIAVTMSDQLFNRILSIVMVVVLVIIVWKPHKRLATSTSHDTWPKRIGLMVIFFFVGVYGGFIQAGVGFIIIAALTLVSGLSLVKINSIKVFVVAIYTLSALIVFIVNDQVHWGYGIALAAGMSLGAFLGSRFAVKHGDKWVQRILIVAVVAMAIRLFFQTV